MDVENENVSDFQHFMPIDGKWKQTYFSDRKSPESYFFVFLLSFFFFVYMAGNFHRKQEQSSLFYYTAKYMETNSSIDLLQDRKED